MTNVTILFGLHHQHLPTVLNQLQPPPTSTKFATITAASTSPVGELITHALDDQVDHILVHSRRGFDASRAARFLTHTVNDAANARLTDDSRLVSDVLHFVNHIVVLDAAQFFTTLGCLDATFVPDVAAYEDDFNTYTSHMFVEQVESANVIILCNESGATAAQRADVRAAVTALNRDCHLRSIGDDGRLDEVLQSDALDLDAMRDRRGWLCDLRTSAKPKVVLSGARAYVSFVYGRRRPMHAGRLAAAVVELANVDGRLLRSKGTLWIASRNDVYAEWSLAGSAWSLLPGGYWLACLPVEQWPSQDKQFIRNAAKDMCDDERIGDRRQEVVFIGLGIDREQIERILDKCLLDEKEMDLGEEVWKSFNDPFEEWGFSNDEDESGDDESERPAKRAKSDL